MAHDIRRLEEGEGSGEGWIPFFNSAVTCMFKIGQKFNPMKFLQPRSVKGGGSEKMPILSLGACQSRFPARPGQASLIRPMLSGGRGFRRLEGCMRETSVR